MNDLKEVGEEILFENINFIGGEMLLLQFLSPVNWVKQRVQLLQCIISSHFVSRCRNTVILNTIKPLSMKIPSNPRIEEGTKRGWCTQLSCRALKTQLGQNYALHKICNAM